MQVKKYEASSVIEALKEVKRDLGPDAIVLSTQEAKRSVTGAKKFIVVAAVSENQLKKKEMAEKQMESVYKDKVSEQSAMKQKMFIENVYRGIEKKHEGRNKRITATPYIDIADGDDLGAPLPPTPNKAAPAATSSMARVKQAAQDAFKSSLTSDFFGKEEPEEELLDDRILKAVVKQNQTQSSEAVSNMVARLKACGVSQEICIALEKQCIKELGSGTERRALVDSWFAKAIMSQVQVARGETQEAIELYVGPHGSGKTSALVKQATHYVMQENKSVAIITSDLNKVGGVEQLRVYSRILNAPVYVVSDLSKLEAQIDQLDQYDKILVDTPGISLSNLEELDSMRAVANMNIQRGVKTHLVISALTKENDLE